MTSGRLNAANTEVANVKTAAVGFLAENSAWPTDSTELTAFLEGTTKAQYNFGGDSVIDTVTGSTWGADITWAAATQTWDRA
ncbi:hypothetical protein ES708_29006 [subsurface metagenome]